PALRSDDEGLAALLAAREALEGEGGEVERRRPAGDELRDVRADRRRLLEAMAGEAGRVEKPRRLRRLADDRVVIRADLVVAPPRALDREICQHRQPPDRRLGELLERLLATAEDEARPLAVEVEAGREVDRQRHALREPAVLGREPHPPRLADDRDLHAGEPADLGRPRAGGADDAAGRDPALRRLDRLDPAAADVDPCDRAAL